MEGVIRLLHWCCTGDGKLEAQKPRIKPLTNDSGGLGPSSGPGRWRSSGRMFQTAAELCPGLSCIEERVLLIRAGIDGDIEKYNV